MWKVDPSDKYPEPSKEHLINRRQIKFATIPNEYACGILSGRTRIINLPEDAEIAGYFHDWLRDGLGVYIYSSTYPRVEPCLEIGRVELIYQRVDNPAPAVVDSGSAGG